jgi:hypothetical protein
MLRLQAPGQQPFWSDDERIRSVEGSKFAPDGFAVIGYSVRFHPRAGVAKIRYISAPVSSTRKAQVI